MEISKKTNYDTIADQYSTYIDGKSWNRLYERPYLTSFLKNIKGKHILDAACGSGFYAEYCIQQGAYVTAIDASSKMIEITKKRVGSSHLAVHVADLSQPINVIADASHDIVISSLTLHYIKDLSMPLREFHRVLKRKGEVLVSMHHPFIDYLHLRKENYFTFELIEDTWDGFGGPMKVNYYTRPLCVLLKPFLQSEFNIVDIDEPLPGDLCKKEAPEEYERLTNKPAFLFLRLQKD